MMTVLKRGGYFSVEQRVTLFRFIDWLVQLTPELDIELKQALNKSMKEADMQPKGGYTGLIFEEGRQKGQLEGMALAVLTVLENRFGKAVDPYRERLENASEQTLSFWLKSALSSTSADEVFN